MSTIPNQVSSERSTAQSMDISSGAHGQSSSDAYTDNPTTGVSRRSSHMGGSGSPSTSYPRAESTPSERDATNNYRSYGASVRESERSLNMGRGDGNDPNVSYAPVFSVPAHPANIPPPPTTTTTISTNNHNNTTTPASRASSSTPNTAHPQHPPIATLDSLSPVDSPLPPKKRKAMYDSPHHASNGPPATSPVTPSSAGASTSANQASRDAVKRTKTSRACDPCRRKKIRQVHSLPPKGLFATNSLNLHLVLPGRLGIHTLRCDVLQSSDPPICAHCKQYGFECTFFLPITETRWKKRKLEEDDTPTTISPIQKAPSAPLVRNPSRSESTSSAVPGTFPIHRSNSETLSLSTPVSASASASIPAPPRNDTRIYGTHP